MADIEIYKEEEAEEGIPSKRFKCDECPKNYTRTFRLKQHIIQKHTEIIPTPFTSSIPLNNLQTTFKQSFSIQRYNCKRR